MCGLATILVFQGVPSCWRTSLRSNSWSLRIRRRRYRRRRSKTASSVAHSVEVADQPHNLEVRSRLLFCQISRVGKLFRNLNKFSVWMFGQSQIECIKHLHVVSFGSIGKPQIWRVQKLKDLNQTFSVKSIKIGLVRSGPQKHRKTESNRKPNSAPALQRLLIDTAHCCRSGRKLDFSFQWQFQRHMNRQGVGFQGI